MPLIPRGARRHRTTAPAAFYDKKRTTRRPLRRDCAEAGSSLLLALIVVFRFRHLVDVAPAVERLLHAVGHRADQRHLRTLLGPADLLVVDGRGLIGNGAAAAVGGDPHVVRD